MLWFVLALCTAFIQANKEIYLKYVTRGVDEHVVVLAMWLFALPFLLILLYMVGVPDIQPMFWVALLVSGTLGAIGSLYVVKGLKISEVSLVVPLLSFTPAFMLITSPLILGEFPSLLGVAGILLIVVGSYVLNIDKSKYGILMPFRALVKHKGSRYVLFAAFLFSITTNTDKIGVLSSSPFMWGVGMTSLASVILFFPTFKYARKSLPELANPQLWVIGLLFTLVFTFHMIAIQMTLVAYVIAIKRTSILIAIVIAHILYKERKFKSRFSGAAFMLVGVTLIAFS